MTKPGCLPILNRRRPRALSAGLGVLALLLATLACNLPGSTVEPDFPSVTITSPATNARVLLGRELSVESTVTHPNGVARVELWVDGARYRSDDNPQPQQRSFSVVQRWTATALGLHTIEVRVFSSATSPAGAAAQITVDVVASTGELTVTPLPGASESPPGPEAGTPSPSPSPTATGTPTGTLTPTPAPTVGGMVLVPAGPFLQGSNSGRSNERPQRTVTLSAFYIDKYEVTTAQFKAFAHATGYQTSAEKRGDANNWHQFDTGDRQNQPVRWISWNDAQAFCQWAGKRLPTEAQWEKAARGTDGRQYPWGNNYDAGLVPHSDAADVGSFANASPYGVYDMAGNVWEWVADWYDANYYANDPPDFDPLGPASGVARVLRGGGYNNGENELRTSYRHNGGPDGYAPDHGIRCAR